MQLCPYYYYHVCIRAPLLPSGEESGQGYNRAQINPPSTGVRRDPLAPGPVRVCRGANKFKRELFVVEV
jgi:hypothetical protein